MTGIDWIGVGYAVSLAAGGIIGYASAKSVPSLVAGLTFGSMAAAGAYQTSTNPKDVRLSFATSAIVMAVMGMRFINTGKWMPAGFIAGASLLLVLKHGFYMSIGKYD